MENIQIDHQLIQDLLQKKTTDVILEPEYNQRRNFSSFMTDSKSEPVVRVAITNFLPDLNIWEGLQTPAHVGRFPLAPADIWEHYAANNFKSIRPDGTSSILAVPETFEQALNRIRRIVIISGILTVNPKVYEYYAEKIELGDQDPFDYYKYATQEVADIIDKAIGKLALSLMAPDRAVVPMNSSNTQKIIDRTRGDYKKGSYNGPCNNHWPQNSIAVMSGLLQFGINRLPFRDETDDEGNRQRLYGRYRSIVIFDREDPVSDGTGGITMLNQERLARLRDINSYTRNSQDIINDRYCTYNQTNKEHQSICGLCIKNCPSNALSNSSPGPDGVFSESVKRQAHRFWEEELVFDFKNCISDRNQKADLFEDYVCARCEAICAARGVQKSAARINHINREKS